MWLAYVQIGLTEDSYKILHDGKRLSLELGDTKGIIHFSNSIGFYFNFIGKPKQAIKEGKQSFEKALHLRDIALISTVSNNLSHSYLNSDEPLRARAVIATAFECFENINRWSEMDPVIYADLCGIYAATSDMDGNFQEAKTYHEKGLRFTAINNSLYGKAIAELWYGMILLDKGDGKQAVSHIQNEINYWEKVKNRRNLANSCRNIGREYFLLGEFEKALMLCEKGIRMRSGSTPPRDLYRDNALLGDIFFAMGDLEKSLMHYQSILNISEENDTDGWITRMPRIGACTSTRFYPCCCSSSCCSPCRSEEPSTPEEEPRMDTNELELMG